MFEKVQTFENSSQLLPVYIEAEWYEPFSKGSESCGQAYVQGIFQEVFSISSAYQDLEMPPRRLPTVRLVTSAAGSHVRLSSTTVALKALIDRIEYPGTYVNASKLGHIMHLEEGAYICTLILTFQNFHVKIRLFRKEPAKKK